MSTDQGPEPATAPRGATDERLTDAPQADETRPDLAVERAYPGGSPTYTSATAIPGEPPLSGSADPAVAAGFNDGAVRQVQRLIEANIKSARALESAAERAEEHSLQGRFREIASQRHGFAEELQGLVRRTGSSPVPAGTRGNALQRWWRSVHDRAGPSGVGSMLDDAERGEDELLHEYRAALGDGSLNGIVRVIGDQTAHVQRVHDEIKELRDRWWSR